MSLARLPSPISSRTPISMSQLRGLPLPPIHSLKISKLICSASPWYFATIVLTSAPVWSFSSKTPNMKYFALICWGMLILPFLPGKLIRFTKFGFSSANTKKGEGQYHDYLHSQALVHGWRQKEPSCYVHTVWACFIPHDFWKFPLICSITLC